MHWRMGTYIRFIDFSDDTTPSPASGPRLWTSLNWYCSMYRIELFNTEIAVEAAREELSEKLVYFKSFPQSKIFVDCAPIFSGVFGAKRKQIRIVARNSSALDFIRKNPFLNRSSSSAVKRSHWNWFKATIGNCNWNMSIIIAHFFSWRHQTGRLYSNYDMWTGQFPIVSCRFFANDI